MEFITKLLHMEKLLHGNTAGFKAEIGRAIDQYDTGVRKIGRTPPKKN